MGTRRAVRKRVKLKKVKEKGQLLLERGFLTATPGIPQQKHWSLGAPGADFREQLLQCTELDCVKPLGSPFGDSIHGAQLPVLSFPQMFAPSPRFPTQGYCSRGSNKLFPRMRWLPLGSAGKILGFQPLWAQVPREKNCICSLLHPLWEGQIVQ